MRKNSFPAYPGSAWSMDGGTTWIQRGWLTSTTNDVAASLEHPGVLFMAIDPGLLLSTNNGETWKLCTDGSMGAVLSVLPAPKAIWIGTTTGAYVSQDEGATWEVRSMGLPPLDGTYVSSLVGDGSTLIAATAAGIFRSTNGGMSWVPSGLPGTAVTRLVSSAADPRTIAALTESRGLWMSTDAGVTWNEGNKGLPSLNITSYAFHPMNPAIRLIGIAQHGILRSTDAGRTWSYVNAGISNLQITALGFDPRSPNIVLAGSGTGAFISTDGAATWKYSDVRFGFVSAVRFFPPASPGTK